MARVPDYRSWPFLRRDLQSRRYSDQVFWIPAICGIPELLPICWPDLRLDEATVRVCRSGFMFRSLRRQPISIYIDRILTAMGGMRTAVGEKEHPVVDPLAGVAPAGEGMQIDVLILQRASQPFDEAVDPVSSAIRRPLPAFRGSPWRMSRTFQRRFRNRRGSGGIRRWHGPPGGARPPPVPISAQSGCFWPESLIGLLGTGCEPVAARD